MLAFNPIEIGSKSDRYLGVHRDSMNSEDQVQVIDSSMLRCNPIEIELISDRNRIDPEGSVHRNSMESKDQEQAIHPSMLGSNPIEIGSILRGL